MVSRERGIASPSFGLAELFDFLDGRELTGVLLLERKGRFRLGSGLYKGYAAVVASGTLMRRQGINDFPGISHNETLLLFYS